MREIKFRAWDGDEMHLDVIPIEVENEYKLIQSHPMAGMRISPFTVKIMQHAGLKDNIGVDIYEGDKDKHGRTVVYRNGCFHLVNGVGQTLDYLFNYTDMNGFMVDGNIYESRNNE